MLVTGGYLSSHSAKFRKYTFWSVTQMNASYSEARILKIWETCITKFPSYSRDSGRIVKLQNQTETHSLLIQTQLVLRKGASSSEDLTQRSRVSERHLTELEPVVWWRAQSRRFRRYWKSSPFLPSGKPLKSKRHMLEHVQRKSEESLTHRFRVTGSNSQYYPNLAPPSGILISRQQYRK